MAIELTELQRKTLIELFVPREMEHYFEIGTEDEALISIGELQLNCLPELKGDYEEYISACFSAGAFDDEPDFVKIKDAKSFIKSKIKWLTRALEAWDNLDVGHIDAWAESEGITLD